MHVRNFLTFYYCNMIIPNSEQAMQPMNNASLLKIPMNIWSNKFKHKLNYKSNLFTV